MIEFINDNGQSLSYIGDDITFTKQIASFRDFKIKGDFTVSFNLDNNSQNRKALGYYGVQQIGNHAFAPNKFNLIRNGNFDKRGDIIIEDDDGQIIGCYFVSGNANWISLFDFPANKIINTAYQLQFNYSDFIASMGRTYGLTVPVIDYAFYRNKFDRYFLTGLLRGAGDKIGATPTSLTPSVASPDLYPCLFIHTLVQELGNVVNVKISGDLMTDQLYNTLIMTPAGPDLVDVATGNVLTAQGLEGATAPYIQISSIPDPSLKAIDVIKWLCFSFGCIPTFDEFSQTLSLNGIDKIKKESALNWSDFFQSFQVKYSNFFENNYIHAKSPLEDELNINYNQGNLIPFGEVNIKTKKQDGSKVDLYTSPFAPVKDDKGTTALKWQTPFVQFLKFKDQDVAFSYTSVSTDGTGRAIFHADFSTFSEYGHSAGELVFRVIDDTGIYTGYHVAYPNSAITIPGLLVSQCDFISNSTGSIYFQSMTKQNTGNRILVCVPDISSSDVMTINPNFHQIGGSGGTIKTSIPTAYYSKPIYVGNLNNYQKGLNYGEINLPTYNDISLVDSYFNKINAFIRNPPLYGFFIIPEVDFCRFDFSQFIYVKSERLTGYFLVEAIENYKDALTVVRATLNYLDGYSALTGYSLIGVKAGYPDIDPNTGQALGYDSTIDYDKLDTLAD